MNQNDQMRALIDAAEEDSKGYEDDPRPDVRCDVKNAFFRGAHWQKKQALSHVNKTPKNEHESDDVLNKSGNADMVRNALQQVRRDIESLTALQNGTVNHIVKSACGTLDRVLQALAAEPTPLVRLTDEEQTKIVRFFDDCGLSKWQSLWQCSNAIIDAMERVNGGQLDNN